MKKNIKSAALVLGICFFAAPAMAQLASDAPALTAAQIAELQKKPVALKQPTVQLSSDGAALNAAQVAEIQKKQAASASIKPATTQTPDAKTTAAEVKPSQEALKAEPKIATPVAPTQKQ